MLWVIRNDLFISDYQYLNDITRFKMSAAKYWVTKCPHLLRRDLVYTYTSQHKY